MPDDYAKIIVAANHGELTRVRNAMAISGTINAIKCHIEFRTKDWNVLNKTIVFARGKATASTPKEDIFPPQILDDSNECIVPPGVLNEKYFSIGLIGFEEDYRIVTNWLHYRVEDGCYAEGSAIFDPPKTIYDEILEELKNHNHDERYYTKEESDELLDAYAKKSDIEGLILDNIATNEYVDKKVSDLVSSAPETLDTLQELSKALGDDPNFATTIAAELGNKVDKIEGKGLSTNDYTDEEKAKLASISEGAGKAIQPDWNQNDSTAKDYIKNKPAIATDDDAMDFLAEMGMITPVTNSNGEILISSSNKIYSL